MQSEIKNMIYQVRGFQVMLDSDLAQLFNIETKSFNQAVKRNSERFPGNFMFQLTKIEYECLRSQFVILDEDSLRSQNVTLKNQRGQHRKYLPYVFTEHGVAMLSGILRSEVAVQISIQIISAFIEIRKFIAQNIDIFGRLENIEYKQLAFKKETEQKFEQIFDALQGDTTEMKQNIFFNGQIYDAYSFIIKLIQKANKELLIIDSYIDNSVLDMLSKKNSNVSVTIITHPETRLKAVDIKKFNLQYPLLKVKNSTKIHDRFVLIDNCDLYHIGASIKDLGKKCFAFSQIEDKEIIVNLLKIYNT
jgi:phage regulator Rha-like protein